MKTIKQLEKEIEEPKDFDYSDEFHMSIFEFGFLNGKLQQLKKVYEEIEEDIKSCISHCFCKSMNIKIDGLITSQKKCGNCHAKEQLEEILKKFQGERK